MSDEGVEALERALGHRFADPSLAALSLAHPSWAHDTDGTRGNERLEFLGDAVLDLIVAGVLFERHPDWSEGQLTRARAALVKKESLARHARELELGALIRLGRTEEPHGREKDSILANCFEAVIGALYLDGGLAPAHALVERVFARGLDEGTGSRDPKTAFQEWAHVEFQATPSYHTVADSGVENDPDRFTVEVRIGARAFGRGVGRTKRAAERDAAGAGLREGEVS